MIKQMSLYFPEQLKNNFLPLLHFFFFWLKCLSREVGSSFKSQGPPGPSGKNVRLWIRNPHCIMNSDKTLEFEKSGNQLLSFSSFKTLLKLLILFSF